MKDIKGLERTLKALANKRRLAILHLLKRDGPATVGDIADEIRLSFKATSRHLGVLAAADIVEKEQQSLNMFYRLASVQTLTARHVISIV